MATFCGSFEQLLEKERSARFDAAIAQLLQAYHFDLEAARLGWRAVEAAPSGGLRDSRHKANVSPPAISDAQVLLPPACTAARRPDCCKTADTPVAGQACLGSEIAAVAAFDNESVSCQPLTREDVHDAMAPDEFGSAGARTSAMSNAISPATQPSGIALHSREGSVSNGVCNGVSANDHKRRHLKGLLRTDEVLDRGCLESVVTSAYFEVSSACTLLFFCMLTALDMQREGLYLGYELGWPYYREPADTGWAQAGDVLSILTYVCIILFTLEVIIRILALRCAFFSETLNYCDIAILLGWAMEAFGNSYFAKLGLIRLLRLLRLLRFVKLFRLVAWLDSLDFMIKAIRSSLKILFWCSMVLFAIQTVTAFLISQLLFAFYFTDMNRPIEERLQVFQYFGSFSRSLLTTFEMALGNWLVPARVLFENVSEWFVILFVLHKMTVGFSVLGIINSVFVQETLQLATSDDHTMVIRKERQAKLLKGKLDRLFCAADSSGDGNVSRDEFKEIVQHRDVRIWLASMEFDCKDPDQLFDLLDTAKKGELSTDDFFAGMTELRGQAKAMDLLHITKELREIRKRMDDLVQDGSKQSAIENEHSPSGSEGMDPIGHT